jgi:hypothetical protein
MPPGYTTMLQAFGNRRNNARDVFQQILSVTDDIYISAFFTKDKARNTPRSKAVWQFFETHLQLSKKLRQIFSLSFFLLFKLVSSGLKTFSEITYFLLRYTDGKTENRVGKNKREWHFEEVTCSYMFYVNIFTLSHLKRLFFILS